MTNIEAKKGLYRITKMSNGIIQVAFIGGDTREFNTVERARAWKDEMLRR